MGTGLVDPSLTFICPKCGRMTSVPEWCTRPICVHAWDGNTPEIWDGDNTDGEGRTIEESLDKTFRVPGTDTWAQMITWTAAVQIAREDNAR